MPRTFGPILTDLNERSNTTYYFVKVITPTFSRVYWSYGREAIPYYLQPNDRVEMVAMREGEDYYYADEKPCQGCLVNSAGRYIQFCNTCTRNHMVSCVRCYNIFQSETTIREGSPVYCSACRAFAPSCSICGERFFPQEQHSHIIPVHELQVGMHVIGWHTRNGRTFARGIVQSLNLNWLVLSDGNNGYVVDFLLREERPTDVQVREFCKVCVCPLNAETVIWNTHESGLCDRCSNDWVECTNCHSFIDVDRSRAVILGSGNSTSWCRNCANGFASWCDPCSYYYVEPCQRRHRSGSWARAGRNHDIIQNYSYKPSPVFRGTDKAGLFIGMELEVENCSDDEPEMEDDYCSTETNELARGFLDAVDPNRAEDLLYLKHDGSLDNGWEIVTHPCSFEFWMKEFPFEKIEALKLQGIRSGNTETAGNHFHLSKQAFTNYHLYKFMKFHYDNEPLMLFMAQRDPEHWGAFNQKDELVHQAHYKEGNHERYTAINLQNFYTVELRYFKGNLRKDRLKSRIQFIHAAFVFTKQAGANDLTTEKFMDFVKNNRKTYRDLFDYLHGVVDRETKRTKWTGYKAGVIPESVGAE